MKYILVKSGIIQNNIEIDPANIHDGNPCPENLLRAVPQPDLVTPQPDLVTPQPDIEIDGEMVAQPDLITPQPPIITPVDPIMVDPRWIPPSDCELIQSDIGGVGDTWPLPTPVVNPNDNILSQIRVLEASITDRRIREAVLAIDNGWLLNVNNQIAALRAQLT